MITIMLVEDGTLNGFRVFRRQNDIVVLQLQFVDDIVFIMEANINNVMVLKNLLN